MEDFSDGTNRTIIILAFFFFYVYLKYSQTQLKLKKNMGTIRCNPLEMMIGGLFNEEEATKTFQNCLEYSTSESLSKTQKDTKQKYDDEISEIIEDLKTNKAISDEEKKREKEKLLRLMNQKTNNINDLVQQQTRISDSLENSSTHVEDIVQRISNIFGSFKNIFQAYNNTLTNT